MSLNHRINRIERNVNDLGGSIQCRSCMDGKSGEAAATQALDGSRIPICDDAAFIYDDRGHCIRCGQRNLSMEPFICIQLPQRWIELMAKPLGGLAVLIERYGAKARVFDVLHVQPGEPCL